MPFAPVIATSASSFFWEGGSDPSSPTYKCRARNYDNLVDNNHIRLACPKDFQKSYPFVYNTPCFEGNNAEYQKIIRLHNAGKTLLLGGENSFLHENRLPADKQTTKTLTNTHATMSSLYTSSFFLKKITDIGRTRNRGGDNNYRHRNNSQNTDMDDYICTVPSSANQARYTKEHRRRHHYHDDLLVCMDRVFCRWGNN